MLMGYLTPKETFHRRDRSRDAYATIFGIKVYLFLTKMVSEYDGALLLQPEKSSEKRTTFFFLP